MADDELIFDGKDFEVLSRQLHDAAEMYERDLTPTMGGIGKLVATTAQGIAGQKSEKVAETIKSRTIPAAAVIEAGNADTPIAALWQVGNKGSRDKTHFRHPVFGRKDVWVEQPMFRYLTEALRVTREARTRVLEVAWERVLRRIEEGRR